MLRRSVARKKATYFTTCSAFCIIIFTCQIHKYYRPGRISPKESGSTATTLTASTIGTRLTTSMPATYYWKLALPHIMSDIRTRNSQYFAPALTKAMQQTLMKTLEVFVDALEAANLSYLMCAGTLLGSYMHHGIIPWDDDIDLFVAYRDREKLLYVLRQIQNKRFPDHNRYSFAIPADQYRWKFFSLNGTSQVITENKDVYYWPVPFIDICLYDEDDDTIWDKSMGQPDVNPKRFNKAAVFPLGLRPFEGMILRAPRNSTAFLIQNYNLYWCFSNKYSHLRERFNKEIVKVPCSQLWHVYPFVFRVSSLDNRHTQEYLKIGNSTVNHVTVDEWGLLQT